MIGDRKRKDLLVLASGIGLALSMPGFPLGPLSFIALVPLFFAVEQGSGFLAGYLTGIVFFGLDLRWGLTLSRFSPLAVPGMVLLVAYLALYFGVFGWGVNFIAKRVGLERTALLFAPLLFTLLEIARAQGPLGSAFSDLYLSLYRFPALIQWASVVGPWGITAAIVGVNGAIYLGLRRHWGFLVAAAGMIGILVAGTLVPGPPGEAPVKVAIVSSDVPQKVKLDDRNLLPLLERYVALGQRAAAGHPGLIVFPESILPGYILRDDRLLARFFSLAEAAEAPILFGTGDRREGRIYNSVALVAPPGKIRGIYDMVHPVPFGEYIPGRRLWEKIGLGRFAASFLPVDLSPGKKFSPIGGIGTPICFESTFPFPAREFVRNGAELLVTVTNDAWFAGSSELSAHFAFAVFRAVENRRYLIQAANGGISGIVDPHGRIIKARRGEGIMEAVVYRESGRSPYDAIGEWPLYACFGIIGLILLGRRNRRGGSSGSRPE